MRVRGFVDWATFNLGVVVHPASGIYIGLGPVLLRLTWGEPIWRCDECGKRRAEAD